MPPVNTHNFDCIDLRVFLKTLQRVNDHWLVINIDKLFGNLLPHSVAGTPGDNNRDIRH